MVHYNMPPVSFNGATSFEYNNFHYIDQYGPNAYQCMVHTFYDVIVTVTFNPIFDNT